MGRGGMGERGIRSIRKSCSQCIYRIDERQSGRVGEGWCVSLPISVVSMAGWKQTCGVDVIGAQH